MIYSERASQTSPIVGIVQARMGSSRLPGKALMDIGGHPMLWRVVSRARHASTLDEVVVATTPLEADDTIAAFCAHNGIPCFRGSDDDVLDRYYHAALEHHAETIVRITADCPLLDPAVIDQVVNRFLSGAFDYVSNTDPPTYPDGLDTEVFSFAALERAWKEAHWQSEREHVTPYLKKHPEWFRKANVTHDTDLSNQRWTVDEWADLAFVRAVVAALPTETSDLETLLALLRARPELRDVNAEFTRDEGYARSLREDRIIV
jgi:spore coat polysaccharide biosynthesis protein SpsF (cytidylyltransferase family)